MVNTVSGYEGATFFKVNGHIDYTVTLGTTDGTLTIRNTAGTTKGTMKFDVFPKKQANSIGTDTPSWGSVIPITRNGVTFYYAILFGMRFFSENQFGYGDMWVYKTLETNTNFEF